MPLKSNKSDVRARDQSATNGNDETGNDKISALQQQINGNSNGNQASQNQINGINTNTNSKATKLNGLKNRILQRPPPLILDKVSNFYDNNTQFSPTKEQMAQMQTSGRAQNEPAGAKNDETKVTNKTLHQQPPPPPLPPSNQNNSANHKFWASLNQNVSRTKSLICTKSVESAKESAGSANLLGPDLIITHRNHATQMGGKNLNESTVLHKSQSLVLATKEAQNSKQTSSEPMEVKNELDAKPHDLSNNSELDDSSNHGGGLSENAGGNLIGVDNATPPASTVPLDSHRTFDEPPASATSSRPRSNNPFLATEEELLLSPANSHNSANFHNRPASFIAATDSALMIQHQTCEPDYLAGSQQGLVEEKFNDLHISEHQTQSHLSMHRYPDSTQPYLRGGEVTVVPQDAQDHRDSSLYGQVMVQQQPNLIPQNMPIYGTYYPPSTNYSNYESSISIDSHSTACKPPPSATMQLPHWTEAIYELNNAILESSSVAGGAENGEFIYIAENGDIVLELDHIKVSGFTLIEFKELVESQQVHLLKAVQTKHSHGLTTDLKSYLNCGFPKNSIDKELQDLIRDNIYRKTIPCTTRSPKEDELDNVDYHFLSKEQFIEMNNRGMLLECGMYGGHYYGTMRPFSDLGSLSLYDSHSQREISEEMRQPLNDNHPALGLATREDTSNAHADPGLENPLYENHESLRMHQLNTMSIITPQALRAESHDSKQLPSDPTNFCPSKEMQSDRTQLNIVAVDSEALPHGWERVIDQTHGTYYIDHNTQRTQYERPYEIELTKGTMGFGFTLVEAENGILLVRSIIPGGPAHLNGTIRPGDILISAVGVSVAGLQHTDIARLFSTFAVGDRVRLTFARSAYVVDANLVPDEYLFSNGTNGDLAVAVNSNYLNYFNQNMVLQNPHIVVDQEFEFITLTLKRGNQGFGFTISDSMAGQKVRKIQNDETCTKLKQGDILINLNGQDITKLSHKEVVEQLKQCPPGKDATLIIKRKKRFRSKTPLAMRTENEEYSLESTPQRNCKTPSLDGLMLRRSSEQSSKLNDPTPRTLIPNPLEYGQGIVSKSESYGNHNYNYNPASDISSIHALDPSYFPISDGQSIYGTNNHEELYYNRLPHQTYIPNDPNINANKTDFGQPPSVSGSNGLGVDSMIGCLNPSGVPSPQTKFANIGGLNQVNQYNNFMNNDKLVLMQMQQQRYQSMPQPPTSMHTPDYHQVPLYSNSDMLHSDQQIIPTPAKPINQYLPEPCHNYQDNYYANNEEVDLQRLQYEGFSQSMLPISHQISNASLAQPFNSPDDQDECEYHQVDLDRGNTDSNWGIRLIGGSEVGRAISIGSIVFGGAASKNGRLKSGDEIISINGINVVGATHQHVVELISTCSNRASLVVRRKKYAEACEVVLTRNMDEGFGFVIITKSNCALIGCIIEGSPADRCQQLHVRDRIIAVNGRYITPNMQHSEIVSMIKERGSTLRLRIIPADCYTVELIKSSQNDNFGFSMRGGSEYDGMPLYILRVAPNGLARDLLNVGDQIIEINGIPTVGMTHLQAAAIIKYSDPIVKLKLRRNYITPPSLLVDSPRALQTLQKFNQVTAEMKTVNLNSTPSFQQDNSVSSDLGSLSQQNSSLIEDQQRQLTETEMSGNSMMYNQSAPLYAS